MDLYLNGQRIELSEDAENVLLNFQASSFVNFGEVTGANSATFSIPPTENNVQILGPLHLPGFQKTTPYQKIDALIFSKGLKVLEGFAIIKSGSETFEANLFGTNSNWIDRIKDVPLRSLDYGIEMEFSISDFFDFRNTDFTAGQVVPVANYGWTDFWIFPTLPFYFLRPVYYTKFVLSKIFEFAGVTPSGTFWEWPGLAERILPITSPFIETDPAEVLIGGTASLSAEVEDDFYSEFGGNSFPVPIDVYSDQFTEISTSWPYNSAEYNTTQANVSIDATIVLLIDEFCTSVTFEILDTFSGPVASKMVSGLTGPAEISLSINVEMTFVSANSNLQFNFYINNAGGGVDAVKSFNVTIQNRNSIAFGGLIKPEFNLPNIKINDFVSDLAIRYGLVFSQSPANPTELKIDFIEDVLNRPATKNWSAFVNYSNAIPVEFKFGEYFKKNFFKTAPAENETLLFEKQKAGIYDGNFEIIDQTLEDEGTIFESIFAPILTRASNFPPQLATVNEWGTIQTLKATIPDDYAKLQIEENETPPRLGMVLNYETEFRLSSDAVGTSFVDISDGKFIASANENLSNIVAQRYAKFKICLDAAELYSAPAIIPEDEISNLNFTEPIFVSGLNGKFFLNSLTEYNAETGEAILSLLKIP